MTQKQILIENVSYWSFLFVRPIYWLVDNIGRYGPFIDMNNAEKLFIFDYVLRKINYVYFVHSSYRDLAVFPFYL